MVLCFYLGKARWHPLQDREGTLKPYCEEKEVRNTRFRALFMRGTQTQRREDNGYQVVEGSGTCSYEKEFKSRNGAWGDRQMGGTEVRSSKMCSVPYTDLP